MSQAHAPATFAVSGFLTVFVTDICWEAQVGLLAGLVSGLLSGIGLMAYGIVNPVTVLGFRDMRRWRALCVRETPTSELRVHDVRAAIDNNGLVDAEGVSLPLCGRDGRTSRGGGRGLAVECRPFRELDALLIDRHCARPPKRIGDPAA